ncbi:hypothetical protein Solca_1167 [Solitalea canadensis DSM 3403]|uniref:Uncharacterized protein n=1 Tax=Solitalea canadensis (strain ATCC 29591 / DSM 3403 / JCM 21819 / LMG 8368 / NBRC 15130 / NCIMB 12057 / USAM 9D) TaxID=929556 RepID=H8KTD3_SOLCM|nr:hypothetical protein Solca_1167 [Solitalea canadensis DSM 3403]
MNYKVLQNKQFTLSLPLKRSNIFKTKGSQVAAFCFKLLFTSYYLVISA